MYITKDCELCTNPECRKRDSAVYIHDREFALQLLNRLKLDRFGMLAARSLLREEYAWESLFQYSDEMVIEQIATLLLCDRLHLHVREMPRSLGVGGSSSASAAPAAFPMANRKQPAQTSPSSAATKQQEDSTLPPDTDYAAQAAALVNAAKTGVPFCAQCVAAAAASALSGM
jgi:hypothetical protein